MDKARKIRQRDDFMETRLAWSKIFNHPIPKHANEVTYTFGGMIIVLGSLQLITGVILQQFYIPHSEFPGAYESVSKLSENSILLFVRNLHYWGAQILLVIALLHMARVFIAGAYKKPREIQWLAGLGLLILLFSFSYTGTVLKWDQEGVEGLAHQIGIAQIAGPLGFFLTQEFAPSVSLLTRMYGFHVTLLPIILVPLLGLHLILIRLNGISSPKILRDRNLVSSNEENVRFVTHIKRMLAYGSVVALIAIIISIFLPAPLYMRGIEGIEVSKPPWYMLWLYPLENIFGIKAIAVTSGIIILLLAAVPLADRIEITDPIKRKRMIVAMFSLILIFVFLLISGSLSPAIQHHS